MDTSACGFRQAPRPAHRCTCAFPLFSYAVCSQCRRVVSDLPSQSPARGRAVLLATRLVHLVNEFQLLLECFDPEAPDAFLPLKQQFVEMATATIAGAFEPEDRRLAVVAERTKAATTVDRIRTEVVTTEQAYCQDLTLCLEHYVPLLETHLEPPAGAQFREALSDMRDLSQTVLATLDGPAACVRSAKYTVFPAGQRRSAQPHSAHFHDMWLCQLRFEIAATAPAARNAPATSIPSLAAADLPRAFLAEISRRAGRPLRCDPPLAVERMRRSARFGVGNAGVCALRGSRLVGPPLYRKQHTVRFFVTSLEA